MLSATEQSYLDSKPMKRLTFHGVNDLYLHPRFGAYTIEQCIELDAIKIPPPVVYQREVECSDALMRRHLDCVDKYGCGLF